MRDEILEQQIKDFSKAMDKWPPQGVRPLCVVDSCPATALETGLCVTHEAIVVRFFADETVPIEDEVSQIDAVAGEEAAFFQRSLSLLHNFFITLEQAELLKLAVLAELSVRCSPLLALNRIPTAEVERMCAGRDGSRIVPDPPHAKVADGPANRQRRAALMAELPRVHVPVLTDPTDILEPLRAQDNSRLGFALLFAIGLLVAGFFLAR
jgi:hypothetical protein